MNTFWWAAGASFCLFGALMVIGFGGMVRDNRRLRREHPPRPACPTCYGWGEIPAPDDPEGDSLRPCPVCGGET